MGNVKMTPRVQKTLEELKSIVREMGKASVYDVSKAYHKRKGLDKHDPNVYKHVHYVLGQGESLKMGIKSKVIRGQSNSSIEEKRIYQVTD